MENEQIIIKMNSELRHVLAHVIMAIEDVAMGRNNSAIDNIKSIEGLIVFNSDEEMEREVMQVAHNPCHKRKPRTSRPKRRK